MLHPSTVPLSNVKLKIVLKICHMLYNDRAGKTLFPNSKVQNNPREMYARSYITFI